jgi:two-component system LytT family response regulator
MRVIVVEDEPIAREGLCALLGAEESVEVVGAFSTADAARRGVRATEPDAMFVDIEMPNEGGVEFVRSIETTPRPYVVFVTAHENYATTAFDVAAVDYVLKPIEEARLSEAVERVRRAMEASARAQAHSRLASAISGAIADTASDDRRPLTRMSARVGNKLMVVKMTDVSWIEADGDYLRLHSKGRVLLVRMTMRELERRVDPAQFVRAHRSAFVNVDSVVSVEMVSHGEHVALLSDGSRVRIGRSYRATLFDVLGERA